MGGHYGRILFATDRLPKTTRGGGDGTTCDRGADRAQRGAGGSPACRVSAAGIRPRRAGTSRASRAIGRRSAARARPRWRLRDASASSCSVPTRSSATSSRARMSRGSSRSSDRSRASPARISRASPRNIFPTGRCSCWDSNAPVVGTAERLDGARSGAAHPPGSALAW